MADKSSGLRPPSKIAKPSGIPKAGGASNAGSVTSGAAVSPGSSFSIGDRVLVSGTKPGKIEFLGPTQFAPGDWAGVILDKEEGKNDGTVAGVRYFQCEPSHGIFARPAKLVKLDENGTSAKSPTTGSRPGSAGVSKVKTTPLTTASLKAREGTKDTKPKTGMRSPASSIRSLRFGTPSRAGGDSSAKQDFEIGDKVIVNGVKTGIAKFVGEADFAKGTWVGVELDSPQGKNDGSVMGKRYFTCEMLYGLFAPLHKVRKLTPSTPRTSASKAMVRETTSSIARKKATAAAAGIKSPGSSVASVSTASSITAARAKNLNSEVSSRYQRKTTPAGTSALQEALKEKQQHVESLMVERDMERAEMMQATQDAALMKKELDDMNIRYQELVVEKETQLDALKNLVEEADLEKVNLKQQIEEQKTQVEDLQFRLEEEAINRDDMQSELSRTKDKVRELEAGLNIEKNRSHILQSDLEDTRASGVDDKSALDSLYRERDAANAAVQELQAKLKESQTALQAQTRSSDDMDAFEDRISELMQELERAKMSSEDDHRSIESYKLKLDELENEKKSLEATISEMKSGQGMLSEEKDGLQFTIDELKLTVEEKEKALESAQNEISQLKNDKNTLEKEKEDILKSSGDSSQQLMSLNDSLKEKDRTIEQLAADLRSSKDSLGEMKVKHDSVLSAKSSLEKEVPELQSALDEMRQKEKELKDKVQSSEETVTALKSKLEESLSANSAATACLKNVENSKNAVEDQLKELTEKCSTLENTLRSAQEEKNASQVEKNKELDEAKSRLKEFQEKLNEHMTEKDYLSKKNEAMQNKVIELSEQHQNLTKTYEETKSTLSQLQEQSGEETKNLLQQLQELRETNEKQRAMVSESTMHMNEMLQQKIALEEIDKQHRSKILILEADATNHKGQYQSLEEKHQSLVDIHEKIQAKLQKMEKSVPDIEERENVLKREFAKERESLQQTIDITTSLVEETRMQADTYQKEISVLKSESVLRESLQESLKTVEKERDNLVMEIKMLKASPISQSASTEDSGVGSDEELRGQVDFLNSVIVDQQAKIGELNEKINELEVMLLNGEDIDVDQVAEEYQRQNSDQPRAAPRLFCDICDIFDSHDTDDCPTQSSAHYETAGLPPSTHNATKRGEERAYCDNCEMFGHDTEDCTEEDDMY